MREGNEWREGPSLATSQIKCTRAIRGTPVLHVAAPMSFVRPYCLQADRQMMITKSHNPSPAVFIHEIFKGACAASFATFAPGMQKATGAEGWGPGGY